MITSISVSVYYYGNRTVLTLVMKNVQYGPISIEYIYDAKCVRLYITVEIGPF